MCCTGDYAAALLGDYAAARELCYSWGIMLLLVLYAAATGDRIMLQLGGVCCRIMLLLGDYAAARDYATAKGFAAAGDYASFWIMHSLLNLVSLTQCARDDVATRLRKDIKDIPAVHISNPKTLEFQVKPIVMDQFSFEMVKTMSCNHKEC